MQSLLKSGERDIIFAVYAAESHAHAFGSGLLPDSYLVGMVFGKQQLKLAVFRKVQHTHAVKLQGVSSRHS